MWSFDQRNVHLNKRGHMTKVSIKCIAAIIQRIASSIKLPVLGYKIFLKIINPFYWGYIQSFQTKEKNLLV